MARILFDQLGLAERAIIYESESRNTAENARNSKELVAPEAGENWLLITSAFHMPRSIGVFCRQGWPVQPYPVDHATQKGNLARMEFAFENNLSLLNTAIKEWVGLIAYRLSGRTDRFLAGDNNSCMATVITLPGYKAISSSAFLAALGQLLHFWPVNSSITTIRSTGKFDVSTPTRP